MPLREAVAYWLSVLLYLLSVREQVRDAAFPFHPDRSWYWDAELGDWSIEQ